MQLPKGYGYPLKATDRLAPQPHDPQPDAGADAGLHGLPDRLRRRRGRRRRAGSGRCARSGWTWRTASSYPVFNVRKGSGRKGRFTYPNDAENPYGGGPKRNQWVVDRPGVLVATGGPPASGRAPHRPEAARGRRHGAGARLFRSAGEVLRARGRRVVGRGHDRHAARTGGEGAEGRRALHERHLRHEARLVVGVDGDHGRLHGRRRAGQEPVQDEGRPARAG